MARGLVKRFTAWSWSRYSDWVLCPLKAKLAHIVKLPQEKSDALIKGGDVHKEAEAFLKGGMSKLPKSLVMFTDLFKRLKALRKKSPGRVLVEEEWAFKGDWTRTSWSDWDGCWVRIKVDCVEFTVEDVEAVVYDWKTGKFSDWNKAQYEEQLELYALGAFKQYPKLRRVYPKLVYLDAGKTWDNSAQTGALMAFERKEHEAELQKKWEGRVLPMMNDSIFPAKPNKLCGWCPYSKEKGGPCKF